MIKIGITGQPGFIGTHLYNYLGLFRESFSLIPFEDGYFSDDEKLTAFVKSCDVIVHLAAMNRHPDQHVIYETNLKLVRQLIGAMEATGSTPHVLFSSSTQEERNNPYGNSKKEGRTLLQDWAKRNHAVFTGLVIPNVFGPFGNPFYNSVIATFCHQLTHNEQPRIDVDSSIRLIYVGELVTVIKKAILEKTGDPSLEVPHTKEIRVSEILRLLEYFKESYIGNKTFPSLSGSFEISLFNTFRSFIDNVSFYPVNLELKTDTRGSFVETVKANLGGQVSFSTTHPGITRGNHFHTRKIERFAVIKGEAVIRLRRIGTKETVEFRLNGDQPAYVDMPVWYTHNITNTGKEDLYTIFWINEFFDPDDPDTFFEEVSPT
jgi:UDP-2-acetamido-2,6-beta-L-arabino-hexul-4-ose reductase